MSTTTCESRWILVRAVGLLCLVLAAINQASDQVRAQGKPTALAGAETGKPFEDRLEEAAVLIGLDLTLGYHGPDRIINSVQPLYAADGEVKASKRYGVPVPTRVRVEAKPGYVIGAIDVKAGERVDGMRVIFVRRKGDGLDSKDSYESRWIGGTGGKSTGKGTSDRDKTTRLGDGGKAIIGVVGRSDEDLTAIGLIEAH